MALLASGSDPTDMRHVLRSKQVIVGSYMHMEYEVCSINYKACNPDMHME